MFPNITRDQYYTYIIIHVLILCGILHHCYDVSITKYVPLPAPENSATTETAVGVVVEAMVIVVAITAMIVLTVYWFIYARRKGSIDL